MEIGWQIVIEYEVIASSGSVAEDGRRHEKVEETSSSSCSRGCHLTLASRKSYQNRSNRLNDWDNALAPQQVTSSALTCVAHHGVRLQRDIDLRKVEVEVKVTSFDDVEGDLRTCSFSCVSKMQDTQYARFPCRSFPHDI